MSNVCGGFLFGFTYAIIAAGLLFHIDKRVSGLYSYTPYFEINEDGTDLEAWKVQREEGVSEPDIETALGVLYQGFSIE